MKYSRKTFLDRFDQKDSIKFREEERAYVEGSIPKTGRSFKNYAIQLFPDIQQDKLIHYLKLMTIFMLIFIAKFTYFIVLLEIVINFFNLL